MNKNKIDEVNARLMIAYGTGLEKKPCNTGELANQICQLFDAECQAKMEELFKEIESKSHKQATNMLGISLSRTDWQSIKNRR